MNIIWRLFSIFKIHPSVAFSHHLLENSDVLGCVFSLGVSIIDVEDRDSLA